MYWCTRCRMRSAPANETLLRDNSWGISAIVLWELAKLIQLGRISLDLTEPAVETVLSGMQVWPLDLDVARASTRLDFRGDPADELIAATSIVHRVPLLTRDKRIGDQSSCPWPDKILQKNNGVRSHNAQFLADMCIVRPDPVLHQSFQSPFPPRNSQTRTMTYAIRAKTKNTSSMMANGLQGLDNCPVDFQYPALCG